MNWIDAGNLYYRPAVVSRNNVIRIEEDGFTVDPRFRSEESPRRWYFVIETGNAYIFQVVSMAYNSGWDSWNKNEQALHKYMAGEVEILYQKVMDDFDFNYEHFDWIELD